MKIFILNMLFLFTVITAFSQPESVNDISSSQFAELMTDSGYTLVDIRTKQEYKSGYIKGAKNINFYSLNFIGNMSLILKDLPVMIYCNTGYRSRIAANKLAKRGYKSVYNLKNGIMEWNLQGYDIKVSDNYVADDTHKVDNDEFIQITKSGTLVLFDFYAPWCAPCREMMPVIDAVSDDYKHKLSVVKVNADVSRKLIKRLNITSVPCLRVYRGEVMLFEHYGKMKKAELCKVLDRYIVEDVK